MKRHQFLWWLGCEPATWVYAWRIGAVHVEAVCTFKRDRR